MTKTIILTTIIAAAFVIGMIASPSVASAHLDICAQPSVNSLKSVWHGLCDLQQQIDNIQLIPGPQGPAGPQGLTGPQGTPGLDAQPTNSTRFFSTEDRLHSISPGAKASIAAFCSSGVVTGGAVAGVDRCGDATRGQRVTDRGDASDAGRGQAGRVGDQVPVQRLLG